MSWFDQESAAPEIVIIDPSSLKSSIRLRAQQVVAAGNNIDAEDDSEDFVLEEYDVDVLTGQLVLKSK